MSINEMRKVIISLISDYDKQSAHAGDFVLDIRSKVF